MLSNNFNAIYGQNDVYFQSAELVIGLASLSQERIRFDIF